MNKRILVIGGGIAGIESALKIAEKGFEVLLIEREKKIGGILNEFITLYGWEKNSEFLINDRKKTLEANPNIKILLGCELVALEGIVGEFTAQLHIDNGEKVFVEVGAIVVAIGIQTVFCPVKYGFGISEKILGQFRFASLLKAGHNFDGKKFSFVVGKTTENYVASFLYALDTAMYLKENFDVKINIFYKNMKVSATGLEYLSYRVKEMGINFFKFEDTLDMSTRGEDIVISYIDSYLTTAIPVKLEITSNIVVLPEELLPPDGMDNLQKILGIDVAEDSFFGYDNLYFLPPRTNRNGIYIAGSCHAPATLHDTLLDAEVIAGEIEKKVFTANLNFENNQPQVEVLKCSLCLTCYRCCPHSAIKISCDDNLNDFNKATIEISSLACQRCGICSSLCPGKAIGMPGYEDNQILSQIALLEE